MSLMRNLNKEVIAMLITELNLTQKRALAKDIRRCIEPDKAKTTRILKESELRKFLSKEKSISFLGISEIISTLKTNYSEKTIKRLISKVQPSIVWDTCLCKLPVQDIEDMLYNSKKDIIITTAVVDEIMKLAQNWSATNNCLIAHRFLYKIFEDSDSEFCSIVDVPRTSYVDDQLLNFCQINNYELYTYDYVMGLRARARKINVTIFTNADSDSLVSYTPNPTGKNILLSEDLLDNVTFTEILSVAESLQANKFIIPYDFIEKLEDSILKCRFRDFIRFLVNDKTNRYAIYSSADEKFDLEHLSAFTEKNNCIILSSDVHACASYKMNYIPYKLVFSTAFKDLIDAAEYDDITNSTDILKIDSNISASDADLDFSNSLEVAINSENSSKDIVEPIHIENESDNSSTSLAILSKELIPHYSPNKHKISVKNLAPNEQIWVLDSSGKEITPNFKSGYKVYPGYTVIYAVNNLRQYYRINVYKVVNFCKTNYSTVLFSEYFSKEDVNNITTEWRSFAKRAIVLT